MTGYHISIGYNSGYASGGTDETLEIALFDEARKLAEKTAMIANRAGQTVDEVQAYFDPAGCGLNINKHDSHQVMLMASGGGQWRSVKERIARAYCQLLIESMHQRGIEVNLVVA